MIIINNADKKIPDLSLFFLSVKYLGSINANKNVSNTQMGKKYLFTVILNHNSEVEINNWIKMKKVSNRLIKIPVFRILPDKSELRPIRKITI